MNIKVTTTIQIDLETIERIRDIVYWTPGLTISDFIDVACQNHIEVITQKYGKPFAPRESEIRRGRKPK